MTNNKLPHEIREMCDHAEEVADFLCWCIDERPADEEEGDEPRRITLIDSDGNPWPIDMAGFRRWEQSIRSLKQMVMHQ